MFSDFINFLIIINYASYPLILPESGDYNRTRRQKCQERF